ncbi:MAG: hypothetical protein ACOCZ6_06160 [Nanoarchaeota archaeon]
MTKLKNDIGKADRYSFKGKVDKTLKILKKHRHFFEEGHVGKKGWFENYTIDSLVSGNRAS